jgi:hypothetical protein
VSRVYPNRTSAPTIALNQRCAVIFHALFVEGPAKKGKLDPLTGRDHEQEVFITMKKLSAILAAGTLALTLSVPALAAVSTDHAITQPDAETITELQHASETAKREARDGNKNHFAFVRKSREIDHLISRMDRGQQVTQKQIHHALRPVRVW